MKTAHFILLVLLLPGCSEATPSPSQPSLQDPQVTAIEDRITALENQVANANHAMDQRIEKVELQANQSETTVHALENYLRTHQENQKEQFQISQEATEFAVKAAEQELKARWGLLTAEEKDLVDSLKKRFAEPEPFEAPTSHLEFAVYGAGRPFLYSQLVEAAARSNEQRVFFLKDKFGFSAQQIVSYMATVDRFKQSRHMQVVRKIDSGEPFTSGEMAGIRSDPLLEAYWIAKQK